MLRIVWLFTLLSLTATAGYSQSFEFPSKEGRISLWADTGLILKNKTTKFTLKSNQGKDLNDLTIITIITIIAIIAINGSIAHVGSELNLNVANESLIYILAIQTMEGGTELKYYDLIGVPIAPATYPYISVYADNVPVNPQRGVPGNTKKISIRLLYGDLQGSCKKVFVNQIAVSFTDRKREVGLARKQGNEALVASLLTRGASPHLQIKAKAESIGCTDKIGVLKIINPKIKRTFIYVVTASNLDRNITQIISHMNAENKKQASVDAEN